MNKKLELSAKPNDVDTIIQAIKRLLPPERIGEIECFIVTHSLLGHTYREMADISNYTCAYIKELGFQLWQDLSIAMEERITKKNLHLVLKQRRNRTNQDHFVLEKSPPEPKAKLRHLGAELLQFPDGALPLNSPFYIERFSIEDQIFTELKQPGCVIRLKAPRHFGKTSLLHRLFFFAQNQNYEAAYLNFQEADETIFADLDKFLRWFCVNVAQQLDLPLNLDDYWDEDIGSKVSCRVYFQRYLLRQLDCPLVLILDEVNRIFEHPNIALDFLPMLRYWYEQAKYVQTWQKLRMVVAHATEIYVPLKLNQSPFNVGLSITLPQFTVLEIQELAASYALDWQNNQGMQNASLLQSMVGGHPYLTHLLLYHLYIRKGETTLEKLLETASTQSGIYRHHLQNYLVLLEDNAELKAALYQVVMANGSVQLDALTAYKLESLGLIKLKGNLAYISCQLYRLYFRHQFQSLE